MPEVAGGVPVRWADIASPWLSTVGGDSRGTAYEAAIVARVALRYDDEKADLVHDEEYEAVIFPLSDHIDPSTAVAVDYDDRDLRPDAPQSVRYRLTGAPIKDKTLYPKIERGLIDYLVRSRSIELSTNKQLKLYSRPGESVEEFGKRCYDTADAAADAEIAKLRDKYQTKVQRLQTQLSAAEDRVDVISEERKGRRNEEIFSTAGSILGGLLGGRRSRGGLLGKVISGAGSAAGRRSRSATAGKRQDAAENKVSSLQDQLESLETELSNEVTQIDAKWMAIAKDITTMPVPLERTDVKVTQLSLVWIPVP